MISDLFHATTSKSNCKLCRFPRKLMKSHAIPNAYFKYLFRKGSGRGIVISTEENVPVDFSNDSWATFQLCLDCEQKLNNKYEKYTNDVLTNKDSKCIVTRTDKGVLFENIDTDRIKLCLLSILWRCSESDLKEYSYITLSDSLTERLRVSLNSGIRFNSKEIYIDCRKLIDKSGHFNNEQLRNFIGQPKDIIYERERARAWAFVFMGFYFEFFYNIKALSIEAKSEFFGFNPTAAFFQYVDISEIPEFVQMVRVASDKNKRGLVNPKIS